MACLIQTGPLPSFAPLAAIEFMISEIAAALYSEGEPTLEDLDRNIKAFLPTLTLPDMEPVHSDLLAAEIEDAVRLLLSAWCLRPARRWLKSVEQAEQFIG